ncbi:unnamed protein product [Sphagnum compactum]
MAASVGEVRHLFRALLREASHFSNYNVREYVKRKAIDTFHQYRDQSNPAVVDATFKQGLQQLEIALPCLLSLWPYGKRQNPSYKLGPALIHVVHGDLQEPQPQNVQPDQGGGPKLHLGGKAAKTRAKVKWDTLTLPLSHGSLGVIDPKAQSEALLAKLLVRGLSPGGEP